MKSIQREKPWPRGWLSVIESCVSRREDWQVEVGASESHRERTR